MEDQQSDSFSYEDKAEEIDIEIKKRRGKWFLDSLAWFDFEDVEQIIKAHIYKKWHQWDQRRSLKPWVNKIITNQMKNILRNNYSNFVRPCLNCPFNNQAPLKMVVVILYAVLQKVGYKTRLVRCTQNGNEQKNLLMELKWL